MPTSLAKPDRLCGDVALPRRWLWLFRGFRKYSQRYVGKHFHAVRLSRSGHQLDPAPEGPLLIALNHPAWWDPMICMVLSGRLLNRDHFGAIDGKAVRKYAFFTKVGFVGVDTKTLRGAAEFVRTGLAILSRCDRVYWVTAQGHFADVRRRPLGIQAGVGHLAARMTHGTVLPVALEYTFWNERTPEALVRVGEPIRVAERPGLSGREWTATIEQALTDNLDQLDAEAVSRDAGRFTDLVQGKTGVGGFYDQWRRLKAWARGRRFDPSHEGSLVPEAHT